MDAASIKKEVLGVLSNLHCSIDPQVEDALQNAWQQEETELARDVLKTLLDNYRIAREQQIPLCQDTGTVVIFAEVGEELMLTGGSLANILQQAVREARQESYYRPSIVADPVFDRLNTKDNTPAILHTELVKGDRLRLNIALKGGGAENMSRLKMLKPSDGLKSVRSFILDTVIKAGSNPCPPVIVGVGIGGNFETCALLAKKALFRDFGSPHPKPAWAAFERELLQQLNETGIGPAGLGGKTTALAVHIEVAPCHIASLPVAVNLNCHAHRHGTIEF